MDYLICAAFILIPLSFVVWATNEWLKSETDLYRQERRHKLEKEQWNKIWKS